MARYCVDKHGACGVDRHGFTFGLLYANEKYGADAAGTEIAKVAAARGL